MKKLALIAALALSFAAGACKKDAPATTTTPSDMSGADSSGSTDTPVAPADTTSEESNIGQPQTPTDMRPTGSPTPPNTPENTTGGTRHN